MDALPLLASAACLAPLAVLPALVFLTRWSRLSRESLWRLFQGLSAASLLSALLALLAGPQSLILPVALESSSISLLLALLVQVLGTVISHYSARYLAGEAGQRRAIAAFATVLAAVHLLLFANHWILLIGSWALVGAALTQLLCFYPDRPFAQLAAHKKRLADRLADLFLIAAAGLAWHDVGSGSLSALWRHLEQEPASPALQLSAVALVFAVILRTALLPVHGWLIQVMEAPTPVSALLHAGVINLGGFVLIRFAPLLEATSLARAILLFFGLGSAVLAGLVMLTRVSIKVRLAWSTVAQMGFMLLECALGLYSLAALHLIGHSLYKAQAFLSASSIVRETRLRALHQSQSPSALSLFLAPLLSSGLVLLIARLSGLEAWPEWWSLLLGLAWAPMLWLPRGASTAWSSLRPMISGLFMISALTGLALAAHSLPLGLQDAPHQGLGWAALIGMAALTLTLAVIQAQPQRLSRWRRWSYAGFYLDEAFTRITLQLSRGTWSPKRPESDGFPSHQEQLAGASS